jgi:hypothetical protein
LIGFYPITVTGNNTFQINTITISSNPGGVGDIKHGGDKIEFTGFKSVPVIVNSVHIVENVTASTFDVEFNLTSIQSSSIADTIVGTEQIVISHTGHGFNTITDISPNGSTKALITTKVNHGLIGTKYDSISIETIILNTVDVTIASHGLATSDKVLISNSGSSPSIDGEFVIQIISASVFRISFIGGIASISTCNVNTGNTVVFSDTDSVPNISSDINGNVTYYIDRVSDTIFSIDTGFLITSTGSNGILGRENRISLHRVEPPEQGGDNLGGISLNIINHLYHDIENIIDENSYMIRIGNYATSTVSAGGSNIVITSQKHGNRIFQSNTFDGETSGKLFKSISLEGENYIYLVSPNLQTVYSPGNERVGNLFAKILLNEPPGVMMFDSFISAPKIYNPPLASLKEIEFSFRRFDNVLFNFNDIDFSLSLEVTEIVDHIQNSSISSRTGVSDLYNKFN